MLLDISIEAKKIKSAIIPAESHILTVATMSNPETPLSFVYQSKIMKVTTFTDEFEIAAPVVPYRGIKKMDKNIFEIKEAMAVKTSIGVLLIDETVCTNKPFVMNIAEIIKKIAIGKVALRY